MSGIIPSDPFKTLPLRFVLDDDTIRQARSLGEIERQCRKLEADALRAGLLVTKETHPSSDMCVWIIDKPPAGGEAATGV